jgi:hypothetical protein
MLIKPDYVVEEQDGIMTITKTCSISKECYQLVIASYEWDEWNSGELVHKVFPFFDVEEREFIMSGFTPLEQKEIFKDY